MTRDEFEALMRGEGPAELEAVGAFGRLARADREARALARASLDEGRYAWMEEPASQREPLRVAAQDLELPVSYGDERWEVTLGEDYDGGLIAELVRGPEAPELIIELQRVPLRPGELARLPPMAAPPERLVLLPPSGGAVVLRPLPAAP